jgi:hypothetical protein
MKKAAFSIVILLLMVSVHSFAQIDDSTMFKKHKPKERFIDRMFIGGGLGAQFGSKTAINIAPVVGYKITDQITAGVGITYEYYHYVYSNYNFETNIFGGSVFGRYYFTKFLFGQAEVEYLNLDAYDTYPVRRVGVESVLAGGGYIQRFGQNSGVVLMLLYNLTESQYTPYQNPIIRMGVNIGL